jgi:hypothetical protein
MYTVLSLMGLWLFPDKERLKIIRELAGAGVYEERKRKIRCVPMRGIKYMLFTIYFGDHR